MTTSRTTTCLARGLGLALAAALCLARPAHADRADEAWKRGTDAYFRGDYAALARKLSELEVEPVIVVEVRGPADQVKGTLQNTEGVAQVVAENVEDGLTVFEVRTQHHRDLREQIARRLAEKGWALRRLDLKRRGLQDRWNEINNMDEFRLRTDAAART